MQKTELTLSKINKKQVFICFLISFCLNGYWFFSNWKDHKIFKNQGVKTTLYVKSLEEDKTTFFEKIKYTSVARTFYIISNGDTIYNKRKNIWKSQLAFLPNTKIFLPLDQIIYEKNNAKNYQLLNEFQSYSTGYQAISYLMIGPLFLTFFIYLVINIFKTMRIKFLTV